MPDYLQISTTTSSATEAEAIAAALVETHLAACAQIVPQVRSIYRWQDRIEHAEEWLCLLKTRLTLLPQVKAEIKRLHSYDCPEIIAVEIVAGSAEYLHWLDEQLDAR